MALPVVIVSSGGLPMNRLSVHGGLPVTLAAQGLAVTEGLPGFGLPMTFVTEGGSVVLPVPPVTSATWNPADLVGMTLSGSNLTATSPSGAAGVRGTGSGTTGKYYFEYTVSSWLVDGTGVGIGTTTANLSTVASTAQQAAVVYRGTGFIYSGGVNFLTNLGQRASGNVIGVALDSVANWIWFRVAPGGNWNGSAAANPATGAGGCSLGSMVNFRPLFAKASGAAGEVCTANFGSSAFVGAVPSGFTSGWPT